MVAGTDSTKADISGPRQSREHRLAYESYAPGGKWRDGGYHECNIRDRYWAIGSCLYRKPAAQLKIEVSDDLGDTWKDQGVLPDPSFSTFQDGTKASGTENDMVVYTLISHVRLAGRNVIYLLKGHLAPP